MLFVGGVWWGFVNAKFDKFVGSAIIEKIRVCTHSLED